jgi:perosamine synthetase
MLPVCEPCLGSKELEYVSECIRTGWISSAGRFIDEFERRWAEYCGMQFGVAVSNGTTALELAVACAGVSAGDEVILPTFTIISCVQAIVYSGAKPVFVDSEPRTWCMDVRQIEGKLNSRTRAIMPVHIYGHPVDMDPVREIAARYGLKIIEDAAEAHGAEYKARKCGGLGDIATFSFYANKIITTGEGGMLLTNDVHVVEQARSKRNLCFQKQRFLHNDLGHNFRLTNVQAAIGLAQLERIDDLVARKRAIAAFYLERLGQLSELVLPVEEPWAKNVYWMFGIVLRDSASMDAREFAERLSSRGVETRPFFLGMHEQPVLKRRGLVGDERYPVAECLARQGLYLPSGLHLTEADLDQVCVAIEESLA